MAKEVGQRTMTAPARPSELKLGTRVEYRREWGFCGNGEIVNGPALECDRMVWDVRLDNGRTHWGYVEQFRLLNSEAVS